MRRLFVLLGAILGIVVAIGIFMFLQSTRPVLTDVPVARDDIPAGTVLRSDLFRVAQMANLDGDTLGKWITVDEWGKANGKTTTSDVRAGFPVAEAQIDPNSSTAQESRLSLALGGKDEYYIVIPTNPNEIGNYVQPNDRIDLIISIGSGGNKEAVAVLQPNEIRNSTEATQKEEVGETSPMPMSKLVMQNLSVIRLDREARTQNAPVDGQQAAPANVLRLYVKVNRAQLEVLSFVLNNGKHNFAVRAASGSVDTVPVDGVTWEDFVKWFYAERSKVNGNPFNSISPKAP
jgi:Flp pilus assembly protein CpaB